MADKIRHIAFFRFHDGVPEKVRHQALEMLRDLKDCVPGILEWQVEESLDTRKGHIIVENALFADNDALQQFRQADVHQKVVVFIREVADWWIGDYKE